VVVHGAVRVFEIAIASASVDVRAVDEDVTEPVVAAVVVVAIEVEVPSAAFGREL
jgi:hypothetical protein